MMKRYMRAIDFDSVGDLRLLLQAGGNAGVKRSPRKQSNAICGRAQHGTVALQFNCPLCKSDISALRKLIRKTVRIAPYVVG